MVAAALPRRPARGSVNLRAFVSSPGVRPSREEARLAARLRGRDPDALRDVYERHGRTTFGFLLHTLGDRASAEDVQQQLYLEVWQRAADYDSARAGLLTWIMTIARSRAIDQLRRRIPEPRDPTGTVALLESSESSLDSRLDALVDHWHMADLLRGLPAEEADLLRRRFYDGRSQREIAADTGIPLGTVKMRMVTGLQRLREALEAER